MRDITLSQERVIIYKIERILYFDAANEIRSKERHIHLRIKSYLMSLFDF